jgi:hypothetical protein
VVLWLSFGGIQGESGGIFFNSRNSLGSFTQIIKKEETKSLKLKCYNYILAVACAGIFNFDNIIQRAVGLIIFFDAVRNFNNYYELWFWSVLKNS